MVKVVREGYMYGSQLFHSCGHTSAILVWAVQSYALVKHCPRPQGFWARLMPAAIGPCSVCWYAPISQERVPGLFLRLLMSCAICIEAQAMGEAYFCCYCLYVWHAVLSITCAGMLCFNPTGLACCASNLQGWHPVLQTYRAGMLCFKPTGLASCASNL